MIAKAGMVHGVADNARYFSAVASDLMPGVELVHLIDEGLPWMNGDEVRSDVLHRLKTLASFAEESGAAAVLLTCTAFGRLVDDVQPAVGCPVLSVLEVVVDEASRCQGRIGVLASHPGTLLAAKHLFQQLGDSEEASFSFTSCFSHGAFDAVRRGHWDEHNQLVLADMCQLAGRVDIIVAPQPSIERVMPEFLKTGINVPVVTGPRASLLRLKATVA